jgi:TonB family protein
MTPVLLLDDVLIWSAQVCILVTVGALAALTLTHPRGRLVFWQGILAISLLLPAVQPWTRRLPGDASGISIDTRTPVIPSAPSERGSFRWRPEYLLGLLMAGSALRAMWLAAGLLRLRRYRRFALESDAPIEFRGPKVRWFVSDAIAGPVTYGWLRPAILLPKRISRLQPDLREAIALHELIHVGRRDWLFVLAEELIRTPFWFHPAIWFVLSRIQLAREQVVDMEVIRLTSDRTRYLEALVAVAAQRLQPDVAPAPLFLKKRQLAVRVAAVLKETPMSKSRLIACFMSACSAVFIAARLAVWLLPLQSPAQSVPESHGFFVADGPGISVDPGAKLMHREPVLYPAGGKSTGTVVVEATLDSKGEVSDARILSGPDDLRKAALQSVLKWHYDTEPKPPSTVQVSIQFGQAPVVSAPPAAVTVPQPRSVAPPAQVVPRLKSIQFTRVPSDLEQKIREGLPVTVGDRVPTDAIESLRSYLAGIDEHLKLSAAPASSDGSMVSLYVDLADTPPQRIRIGGNVQAANLIKKVTPIYPPEAKAAGLEGTVRLTVTIGKDGTVQNVEVASGDPMLSPVAVEGVKQWEYKPTLLNGQPVEVITQVDVNFTLQK